MSGNPKREMKQCGLTRKNTTLQIVFLTKDREPKPTLGCSYCMGNKDEHNGEYGHPQESLFKVRKKEEAFSVE